MKSVRLAETLALILTLAVGCAVLAALGRFEFLTRPSAEPCAVTVTLALDGYIDTAGRSDEEWRATYAAIGRCHYGARALGARFEEDGSFRFTDSAIGCIPLAICSRDSAPSVSAPPVNYAPPNPGGAI